MDSMGVREAERRKPREMSIQSARRKTFDGEPDEDKPANPSRAWVASATCRRSQDLVPRLLVRQLREDLVYAEAVRLLARRKLREAGKELPNDLLRRQERPQLVRHPAKVHTGLECEALERILAEVDDDWP